MIIRTSFLLLLFSSAIYAQNSSFEDPYGDIIKSVSDIDKELFYEVVEEILFEIEEYAFEDVFGDTVEVTGIYSHVTTYENYIDMPAQFTNSFVHNEQFGEVRLIYNFGPGQEIDEKIAKEWYNGLLELFEEGNKEREWGYSKKTEVNVAGLPERTTFFESEDDYDLNHVEIYYTRGLKRGSSGGEYMGRVVMVFIFPGY